MESKRRKYIDWKKTGKTLQLLRHDNINLRRYVCNRLNFKKGNCSGSCNDCKYEMDSVISRSELAHVFNVSESVIFKWESGKTSVSFEDMLFYSQIAEVPLLDLVVFQ